MRVIIIGAGAVGSFVGARLALAGHDVVLAGRPGMASAVAAHGLTLHEPDGVRTVGEIAAADSIAAALAARDAFDFGILTVKAYDTGGVIAELAAAPSAPPPLITLQNGVGNEEALAAAFDPAHIISGAIDTPVSVTAPGQIQVHRPRFRAGLAPVAAEGLLPSATALMASAGFTTAVYPDYRGLKWSKLLLNLPANAACAILGWTPAQVMADTIARTLEARAWQEALQTAAALRVRLVSLAGYPLPSLAPIARRLSSGLLGAALSRTVSGGRGTKLPSLALDLAGGKRSEVGWLNGAVVRYGSPAGVATPVNAILTDTLTALAEGRADPATWHGRPDRLARLLLSE